MSDDEVLSQDEIDVLLHGVDDGAVETEGNLGGADVGVMPYDLTNNDRIVRGRLPTLEMINQRFTRYTRVSMFNLLRETIAVESRDMESVRYGEFLQMLGTPSSVNLVKIRPLKGTALFVLNAELVFQLVDRFFGGGKSTVPVDEREFTPTELRIVQKFLAQVFSDLHEAWKSVFPVEFEYQSSEVNPAMANIMSPSEMVVLSTFDIDLSHNGNDLNQEDMISPDAVAETEPDGEDVEGSNEGSDDTVAEPFKPEGKLQIALPYSMLEPVRETLDAGVQSDLQEGAHDWAESLREDIMYASVPLNCKVAERRITLRDILNFKAGDVIPIEMSDVNPVTANGVPVFDAQLGQSSQHLALKITGYRGRAEAAKTTKSEPAR